MTTWNSRRFGKRVHLTHHAAARIVQRGLDHAEVRDLIETGDIKRKDAEHWWIFKTIRGRVDNPICAAVVMRDALVIKTLMTHWEEHDG